MKILKKSKERTAEDNRSLRDAVTAIIDDVCQRGDTALREYNEKFDDCRREFLRVSRQEIEEAYGQVTEQELADLKAAKENIEKFAVSPEGYLNRAEEFQPAARYLSGPQNYTGVLRLLLRAGRRISPLFYCPYADYTGKGGGGEKSDCLLSYRKRNF